MNEFHPLYAAALERAREILNHPGRMVVSFRRQEADHNLFIYCDSAEITRQELFENFITALSRGYDVKVVHYGDSNLPITTL